MDVTWSMCAKSPSATLRTMRRLHGYNILLLRERNYTIKVFEKLYASLKKKSMSKNQALKLKMDLFEEYSYPKPFPKDRFLTLPSGSPNQAYVMLGQKGTGKAQTKK